MKKKRYSVLELVMLFALLVIGIVATVVLLFKVLEEEEKVKILEKEVMQLSDEVERLSDAIENIVQNKTVKADGINEQDQEVVQTDTYDSVVDMWTAEAGTIFDAEQLDLTNTEQYFCSEEISDEVISRIEGRSYVENPHITLDDLCYMKVLHYNFQHEIQVGELIVNKDLEQEFLNIFRELFEAEYEIEHMYLIDNYWTGNIDDLDAASIEENNTSAFCYRMVTGGTTVSNHGYGCAIDINPQQNPYVDYSSGEPKWYHTNANDYIARNTGYDHVITQNDICYQIFTKYGFQWGGDWDLIKDYQHFER